MRSERLQNGLADLDGGNDHKVIIPSGNGWSGITKSCDLFSTYMETLRKRSRNYVHDDWEAKSLSSIDGAISESNNREGASDRSWKNSQRIIFAIGFCCE